MGGVVSNRVVFHFSPVAKPENSFTRSACPVGAFVSDAMISSEMAGILLRLTVSARDTSVTANVAFSRGSSQQGNARRAAVGFQGAQYMSIAAQ